MVYTEHVQIKQNLLNSIFIALSMDPFLDAIPGDPDLKRCCCDDDPCWGLGVRLGRPPPTVKGMAAEAEL